MFCGRVPLGTFIFLRKSDSQGNIQFSPDDIVESFFHIGKDIILVDKY